MFFLIRQKSRYCVLFVTNFLEKNPDFWSENSFDLPLNYCSSMNFLSFPKKSDAIIIINWRYIHIRRETGLRGDAVPTGTNNSD